MRNWLLTNLSTNKHAHAQSGGLYIFVHVLVFISFFDVSVSVCACCSLSVCESLESAHASNQDVSPARWRYAAPSPSFFPRGSSHPVSLPHVDAGKKDSLAPHSGRVATPALVTQLMCIIIVLLRSIQAISHNCFMFSWKIFESL